MRSTGKDWIGVILLASICMFGCGKATGVPSKDSVNASGKQLLPFEREPQSSHLSPAPTLVPSLTRLPTGTPVTIRLQGTISSVSSPAGETFLGTLDEPIVIDGQTAVARGAQVTGKVLAAKASGRLQDPGYIRIALVSIDVDSKPVAIETSSIFAKGGSHEKHNLAMIGGGTGAGALIGGLAGGGKGALIGSLVGAAGGTGAAYVTGKKDVAFAPERQLTFRLAQPVDLP